MKAASFKVYIIPANKKKYSVSEHYRKDSIVAMDIKML